MWSAPRFTNLQLVDWVIAAVCTKRVQTASRFGSALFLVLLSVGGAFSEPVVRIGSGYSPVMSYPGEDGNPAGFLVEVVRTAAERAGYRVEWVFHPEGVESALNRSAVEVWAAASPTEERRRYFHFTRPWWSHEYLLLSRENGRVPAGVRRRIVFDRKAAPIRIPAERLFPSDSVVGVEGLQPAAELLCSGEADAFLVSELGREELLLNRPEPCRGIALRTEAPPDGCAAPLAVVAPLGQPAIAEAIRQAIDTMVTDGTMERVARRYPALLSRSAMLMLEAERRTAASRQRRWGLVALAALLACIACSVLLLRRSRRQAQAALAASNAAAAARQDFLARISHEIRTPMNAVSGYLEMLKDTALRADQRQFADEIARASNSLLAMLNDVLEFSGMQHGSIRVSSQEFSPADIIDDAVGILQTQADGKSLDLIVSIGASTPGIVKGDGGHLRQIVVNLLANAVKYTNYGSVRVECEHLQGENLSGELRITVKDTGVGIAPEMLPTIFEPFTQAAPASGVGVEKQGAGLGLAISSRLADAMNGTIAVASTVDVGSRFELRVPVVTPAPFESWIAPFRQLQARIVVLAKQGANIDVLVRYLEDAGLDVTRVSTEVEVTAAVDTAVEVPLWGIVVEPNCLTSPLHLFARQIRGSRNGRDLAIVLSASLSVLARMDEQDKMAVDCLLVPPFGARSLRELFGSRNMGQTDRAHPRRVLVVDDNAINRKVESALMEKLGYEVDTAPNGLDAVMKASQEEFAVILMDCQMPVMDGYEATRNIRARELNHRRTPIIAVTANSRAEGVDRCLEAGMDGFVCKPVTLDALRNAVLEVTV